MINCKAYMQVCVVSFIAGRARPTFAATEITAHAAAAATVAARHYATKDGERLQEREQEAVRIKKFQKLL